MEIKNKDSIGFGPGNKYLYTFRVDESDSSEVGEEPVAKKRRIPLANRNYPSLKDDRQRVQQLMQENIVLKVSMKRIWVKEFVIIICFYLFGFPRSGWRRRDVSKRRRSVSKKKL
jgi:hypothetical protein